MYLLDTHIVLFAAYAPEKLKTPVREILTDTGHDVYFSVVNLWEVAIKNALNKPHFEVELPVLRAGLFTSGFKELSIKAHHILQIQHLPAMHHDPFDRLLVAQASAENHVLITADRKIIEYAGDFITIVANG